MKRSFLLIFSIFIASAFCSAQQNKTTDCPSSFAGSFYPGDAVSLKSELEKLFAQAKPPLAPDHILKAIIVPHAGYVFSGAVAASGYNQIERGIKYKRVFVLATSHRKLIQGASIYCRGDFLTPLGRIQVDRELASTLVRNNSFFIDDPSAFANDHVLEVQLPFLQYKFGIDVKILPVMIGTQSAALCKKMAAALLPYFTNENLFVISSDFSHYPSMADAKKTDLAIARSILTNSPDEFLTELKKNESANVPGLVTSCCSWPGIVTLLYMTNQQSDILIKPVDYRNSGEIADGDKNRVVGYNALAVFSEKPENKASQEFQLTDTDKRTLLSLARETIMQYLKSGRILNQEPTGYSETLKTSCGAFVTLKKAGQLRGCIGNFSAIQPLYLVVRDMALAAAFQDTRFEPVATHEMGSIEVEISVLTPLKPIKSADEFILGKQGIYMTSGSRSGTFLPQVAEETHWTKEEFLGHCARDKAGIGWDGWKNARLFTYEAIVFSEGQFNKKERQ